MLGDGALLSSPRGSPTRWPPAAASLPASDNGPAHRPGGPSAACRHAAAWRGCWPRELPSRRRKSSAALNTAVGAEQSAGRTHAGRV